MASKFVFENFVSNFISLAFDRLVSPVILNLFQRKKLDRRLLDRLDTTRTAAQAVLNDAEMKQIKDPAVKKWLSDLKDAVYVAEDLVDEVSTFAEIQKLPGNSKKPCVLNFQDISNRMEDIIDRLESIVKLKDTLGLNEIPKESMPWRVTTSLVETSNIYGREDDKKAIVKLLLDDDASDGELSVIPIVGMGGVGKTTLAQLVYHEVKQSFDIHAWVCVSDEFDVVKVTQAIIAAITHNSCNISNLELLQQNLKEKLSKKRFLVVMDDVWNDNYDEWNMLLKPFQDGGIGSKILLTTRDKNVASMVQTTSSHELGVLSYEDCWQVFAKNALLSIDSTGNPTLQKIGREIVKKCKGLPLAAQTLGGLLRGKYDENCWNHILKSEIWEISENKSKILPALRISYYYLPPYLKECFVYCSLYPQDYRFDKDELILLWMAQNFLQPNGKKSLEEVGAEYFEELVSRSFFQYHEGGVYVMHDLIHDLAISYGKEFYYTIEEHGNAAGITSKTRHLSYNCKGNYTIDDFLTSDKVKQTRTFLHINRYPYMKITPCTLLSQLKSLRVLSFKCFNLDSLPDSIGELIHLRYLNLCETPISTLPESICNLYNLQTLKLRRCGKLRRLPNSMQDLVNLRHLDIRETHLKEMSKGMRKLKHLHFLSNYVVVKDEEKTIKELGVLDNLGGSFQISHLENVVDSGEALEAKLGEKKHITSLELKWSANGRTLDSEIESDILEKLRPHSNLKRLFIGGYRGNRFPNWLGHVSYHNMTDLRLWDCRTCLKLPSLGQLPSLKHLEILRLERVESIGVEFYRTEGSCEETAFPSLETLSFRAMVCWREWHSFEFCAFPQLKELQIRGCPLLTGDLPNHFWALEELAVVELWSGGCNDELRMQELPPCLRRVEIHGKQLVESTLEAMTRTQPTCLQYLKISKCSSALSFTNSGYH